jgi:dihydrofolate synthase / folylpolyglutamate synthase
MTYQQALNYLYVHLPMFSSIGKAAYKKDTTNTVALLQILNNPHLQFKSIHIAGTNGKGSCSHMLAAILQTAGYKTGLYTSPHLKDFRERIRVNGALIEEAFVTNFVQQLQPAIQTINPSFFEMTVAMAFQYFAEKKIDVAVIETGLGGRLDSTNVIEPLLSIITNIGWDHMNILGDSLPAIAFEKAGIIKKNTPVILGETRAETLPVFQQKALQEQAPLILAEEQFLAEAKPSSDNRLLVTVIEKMHQQPKAYQLDLLGLYQSKNLTTVLTAVQQLQLASFHLSEQHLQTALGQVKSITGLSGRWDVVHKKPTVVLDVAHNEAGINAVLQQLSVTPYQHLHIVFGMVKDKAVEEILTLLPSSATFYFTQASVPRALPANLLQAKAQALGKKGNFYTDVNTALSAALKTASEQDLIIVCGSVFVVGEVDILKNEIQ